MIIIIIIKVTSRSIRTYVHVIVTKDYWIGNCWTPFTVDWSSDLWREYTVLRLSFRNLDIYPITKYFKDIFAQLRPKRKHIRRGRKKKRYRERGRQEWITDENDFSKKNPYI